MTYVTKDNCYEVHLSGDTSDTKEIITTGETLLSAAVSISTAISHDTHMTYQTPVLVSDEHTQSIRKDCHMGFEGPTFDIIPS